jgi:hypothetical protein
LSDHGAAKHSRRARWHPTPSARVPADRSHQVGKRTLALAVAQAALRRSITTLQHATVVAAQPLVST